MAVLFPGSASHVRIYKFLSQRRRHDEWTFFSFYSCGFKYRLPSATCHREKNFVSQPPCFFNSTHQNSVHHTSTSLIYYSIKTIWFVEKAHPVLFSFCDRSRCPLCLLE